MAGRVWWKSDDEAKKKKVSIPNWFFCRKNERKLENDEHDFDDTVQGESQPKFRIPKC